MGFSFRSTTSRPPAEAGERVRAWATVAPVGDPALQRVVVSELRCHEEGCPPLETVIAVLQAGVPPRRHTIHLPLAEVTREAVLALAPGEPAP